MKRLLFSVSAIAAVLMAVSCHKEPDVPEGEEAVVSIRLEVPASVAAKSIAQAEHTDIVYYEVWSDDWSRRFYPAVDGTLESVPVVGKKASVELTLVKNKTYNLIFWACNENAGAYDVSSLTNVGIRYEKIAANGNQDVYDAFYAVEPLHVGDGFDGVRVELERPFAQLNFAVDNLDTFFGKLNVSSSTVTVPRLATVFDTRLGTGKVPAAAPVTFKASGLVPTTDKITYEGVDYTWVTMDYMLMMDEHDVVDVTASFTLDGNASPVTHVVHNVPLHKNRRTNILGSIFTADASLTVIVDDTFDDDDEIINITNY